jgi:hypothetical protein
MKGQNDNKIRHLEVKNRTKYGCLSETAGDSTKGKLNISMHSSARRRQKRINFGGCLPPFGPEYFVLTFLSKRKNYKPRTTILPVLL